MRLTGVATFYHQASASLILQSGSEAILVDTSYAPLSLTPPRQIEVIGVTRLGESSTIVRATEVRVLGEATQPPPVQVSLDELASGAYLYRRVEATGVVRSGVREHDGRITFNLATSTGIFQARASLSNAAAFFPDALTDASVTVRGAAYTIFNASGRPVRLQVFAATTDDITVVGAAAADPFSGPLRSIGSLPPPSDRNLPLRRIRVRGMLRQRSKGDLVIDDGTGTLPIRVDGVLGARVDTEVDAVGFLARESDQVVLADSILRRLRSRPSIRAPPSKPSQHPDPPSQWSSRRSRTSEVCRPPKPRAITRYMSAA